jgi:hypothetical protein
MIFLALSFSMSVNGGSEDTLVHWNQWQVSETEIIKSDNTSSSTIAFHENNPS